VFWPCSPRAHRKVQIRSLPWMRSLTSSATRRTAANPGTTAGLDERSVDPITGGYNTVQRTAYYPALGYRPILKPKRIRNPQTGDEIAEVFWDAPSATSRSVVCAAGSTAFRTLCRDRLGQRLPGVPDRLATLIKALSRFAWRLTSKGSRQAAARAKLAAQPSHDRVNREPTTLATARCRRHGAGSDPKSGQRSTRSPAAARRDGRGRAGHPVTMLLGDPGVTGARATAETLDPPTEWMAESRRAVWTEKTNDILAYVIAESVRAPEGLCAARSPATRPAGDVTLRGKAQGTIDITWPTSQKCPSTP